MQGTTLTAIRHNLRLNLASNQGSFRSSFPAAAMSFQSSEAQRILLDAQNSIRGPGGAIAIVHNGEAIAKKCYGFADIDRRITMASNVHLPICSISKQMVCLVLADLARHPTAAMQNSSTPPWEQFTAELKRIVPQLTTGTNAVLGLTLAHLYNMQSGIRDYWAMSMLWGARPDDPFILGSDAAKALERTTSFHFDPGTEYSYSNINFHILARVIENVSGHALGQLLSERVFIPAGMTSAALCPNTNGHPLPVVGYEGNEKDGYWPAVNRMEWSGDAGVVATLDDMIAYEKWLDSNWNDLHSLYREISAEQVYEDGTPARYGFGLGRGEIAGQVTLGHSGMLRGFRLHRVHVPSQRLSVVVLLNHEGDPATAAGNIIKSLLEYQESEKALIQPAPECFGEFLDEGTRLLITCKPNGNGNVSISYSGSGEDVKLTAPMRVTSRAMDIEFGEDMITIWRWSEARTLFGKRLEANPSPPRTEIYVGEYHCADAQSTFHCTGEGTLMYGYFDGYLGKGPVHLLRFVSQDIWLLACPRGLDAPSPGDWTIIFRRGSRGDIVGVTIGCWLARGNEFKKKEA